MRNLTKQVQSFAQFLRSRIFAVGMLFVALSFVVWEIATRTNAVYVVTEGERTVHYTAEDDTAELMEKYLPETGQKKNEIGFDGISGHFAQISVNLPMTATITADGRTYPVTFQNGTTVGELLFRQNIRYDGNDLLNLSPERTLESGDQIRLQRVEYKEYSVTDEIPFETVRKTSPLLQVGVTKEVQAGKAGKLVRTYVQRTVDGVAEEIQLLGEHVAQRPVNSTVLIGSVQPVSPLDFDLQVDENGKPLHFKKVLHNQIATGYSARPGAKTASGMYAVPGHVAVNPNVIPYGTKLYIASPDGSFIYGCAVAADTGTGLLAGVVDVDLFYGTYIESCMNGRKYLDIYVLE